MIWLPHQTNRCLDCSEGFTVEELKRASPKWMFGWTESLPMFNYRILKPEILLFIFLKCQSVFVTYPISNSISNIMYNYQPNAVKETNILWFPFPLTFSLWFSLPPIPFRPTKHILSESSVIERKVWHRNLPTTAVEHYERANCHRDSNPWPKSARSSHLGKIWR